MGAKRNILGEKFGRLTVISELLSNKFNQAMWLCKCDCGNEIETSGNRLIMLQTRSCGCLSKQLIISRFTKHGQSPSTGTSPEYQAWTNMKIRCYDTSYIEYDNYGGRGIIVCDRWINSFENFFADMGKKPSSKHSLDRYPNNDGNYELSNCRWATMHQQKRNMSTNLWFTYNGETMILKDWAERFGVDYKRFHYYVKIKPFEELANKYIKGEPCGRIK